MNIPFNKILSLILLTLVFINIGIFVKGIGLSEDINHYETSLKELKQENTTYEYEIYELESISKTASLAAQLDFGTFNDPIYTDKAQYAYNQ